MCMHMIKNAVSSAAFYMFFESSHSYYLIMVLVVRIFVFKYENIIKHL